MLTFEGEGNIRLPHCLNDLAVYRRYIIIIIDRCSLMNYYTVVLTEQSPLLSRVVCSAQPKSCLQGRVNEVMVTGSICSLMIELFISNCYWQDI